MTDHTVRDMIREMHVICVNLRVIGNSIHLHIEGKGLLLGLRVSPIQLIGVGNRFKVETRRRVRRPLIVIV